jgi:ATP-dependent RNA helicase DDX47/RRP3
MSEIQHDTSTFKSLGLSEPLLEALEQVNYVTPTDIQTKCIPPALAGRDIIGVASTGSGKTAAFALPILQKLWDEPQGLFACVIAPTRELADQISSQFEALGAGMGVRCTVIIGGAEDCVKQAIALAKRPHIIVATPGRLNYHLKSTKGFNLRSIKFLVRQFGQFILHSLRTNISRYSTKLTGSWTRISALRLTRF